MNPLPRLPHVSLPRTRIKAFTLIELLTVIAIIGILAAIIIPTVSKVRASARKTQCVANMRQWGTAVRLFANDFKGTVALYNKTVPDYAIYSRYFGQKYMVDPSRSSTGTQVLSQIVMSRCPVALASGLVSTDADFRDRDYDFIRPLDATKKVPANTLGSTDANNVAIYNLGDAKVPSRLILMAEVHALDNSETVPSSGAEFSANVMPMQTNANVNLVRHGGNANILFLDGHVSSLTLTQTDFSIPANKPIITAWMTLKQ